MIEKNINIQNFLSGLSFHLNLQKILVVGVFILFRKLSFDGILFLTIFEWEVFTCQSERNFCFFVCCTEISFVLCFSDCINFVCQTFGLFISNCSTMVKHLRDFIFSSVLENKPALDGILDVGNFNLIAWWQCKSNNFVLADHLF